MNQVLDLFDSTPGTREILCNNMRPIVSRKNRRKYSLKIILNKKDEVKKVLTNNNKTNNKKKFTECKRQLRKSHVATKLVVDFKHNPVSLISKHQIVVCDQ